jgi:hypothetical protein
VTITAKSAFVDDDPNYAPKNVADFNGEAPFRSNDEPDQWICWDFHERRVQPTGYNLHASFLRSWVLEGSMDGKTWSARDRQTNSRKFRGQRTGSFGFSNKREFRFLRLTQTDTNSILKQHLLLHRVEFFGTLTE